MGIENIDLFPFVLSLSKHERGFAGQALRGRHMDAKTGTPKVLGQDERIVLALRELILSAFQDHFGHAAIIGVNIEPSPLFGSIATVMVREYVSGMDKLAEHMEWEITEDIGFQIAIFVKQPIHHRIAGLLKGRNISGH